MPRKKILVTGAGGQLGSAIKTAAKNYPQFHFLFTDREELSITDDYAVEKYFEANRPDFCINCAAHTAVDKAEDPAEYSFANAINADAVGYLAKAASQYNTKLIHISTDYVFSGKGNRPYVETDATKPVSVYGKTKLAGEQLAIKHTDAIVIRTAWVYAPTGKNFVKTMIALMQSKPQIKVVSDQYGTPTCAADLASATLQIIASENWQPGIYHYTNEGQINWYEFALAIKRIIQSNCEVLPIPTSEYPTPAQRPAWSVLDKSKIKKAYNLTIPDWKDSLAHCVAKILSTQQ